MTASTSTPPTEWTIGQLLSWTTKFLADRSIDEPRLAAEVLLAHALGKRRIDLYTRFSESVTDSQRAQFREWIKRAAAHEPVAYLVGEREFYSLPFRVTPDVLIPRPETETLVEIVLDHLSTCGFDRPIVLDLGTGCGCIAVAILVHAKFARAVATDVSPAALEIARQNAQRHHVLDRFTLVQADRLNVPESAVPPNVFHVLVCNPPYIPAEDMKQIPICIREFEPHLALTDGEDGLSFYRTLAQDGPKFLAPGGVIAVEIGDGRAGEVLDIMQSAGKLVHRETRRDRVVGKERVLMFARA